MTLEKDSGVKQFIELLSAMDEFPEMKFIITKANADVGGRYINNYIDEYTAKRDNVVAVASLGVRRYLSAVKESLLVLGNSSSGITEAPCLNIPTVNIGDRQKGRLMPNSVICCNSKEEDIVKAIRKAISKDFQELVKKTNNPFGDGNTSKKIVSIIRESFEKYVEIGISKSFYDI